MKLAIAILGLSSMCACQPKQSIWPSATKSRSEIYIDAQLKIIAEHAEILKKEGRMPNDFGNEFIVLGQYGWHSGEESSVGSRPPLWLLQAGSRSGGGSF